jgi:hypothetical protein
VSTLSAGLLFSQMGQIIANINSLERNFNMFMEKHNECTFTKEKENDNSQEELSNQKHQCDFCDFISKSKSGLKTHVRTKHNNSRNNFTVETQESESSEIICSALELYCPECDIIYKCEESFNL